MLDSMISTYLTVLHEYVYYMVKIVYALQAGHQNKSMSYRYYNTDNKGCYSSIFAVVYNIHC